MMRELIAILFLTNGLALSEEVSRSWVKPPSEIQKRTIPGLAHRTLMSAEMKRNVGFCVVLPPEYETSGLRYPVVYWLHGGGGNESSELFTAKMWRDAGPKIEPVILVYPHAYRSGYMDHADGTTRVESMIIKELIPFIDKHYRTKPERESRAAHGFSMGSSGAYRFAAKYPDLFCSAVGYGGGAIDLEKAEDPWILDILKRNLNSEPARIREMNTYHFLKANKAKIIANKIEFLLITGEKDSWMASARSFETDLKSFGIPVTLVGVPDVGHSLKDLLKQEPGRGTVFQDRIFRRPNP